MIAVASVGSWKINSDIIKMKHRIISFYQILFNTKDLHFRLKFYMEEVKCTFGFTQLNLELRLLGDTYFFYPFYGQGHGRVDAENYFRQILIIESVTYLHPYILETKLY